MCVCAKTRCAKCAPKGKADGNNEQHNGMAEGFQTLPGPHLKCLAVFPSGISGGISAGRFHLERPANLCKSAAYSQASASTDVHVDIHGRIVFAASDGDAEFIAAQGSVHFAPCNPGLGDEAKSLLAY